MLPSSAPEFIWSQRLSSPPWPRVVQNAQIEWSPDVFPSLRVLVSRLRLPFEFHVRRTPAVVRVSELSRLWDLLSTLAWTTFSQHSGLDFTALSWSVLLNLPQLPANRWCWFLSGAWYPWLSKTCPRNWQSYLPFPPAATSISHSARWTSLILAAVV